MPGKDVGFKVGRGAWANGCTACVSAGYEWVTSSKSNWFTVADDSGACCIPGNYDNDFSCDLTHASFNGAYDPVDTTRLLNDDYSTKSIATPDVALLACPVPKAYCGNYAKVVEIGSLAGQADSGIKPTFKWVLDTAGR